MVLEDFIASNQLVPNLQALRARSAQLPVGISFFTKTFRATMKAAMKIQSKDHINENVEYRLSFNNFFIDPN